jgi:GNAT superfamily N-acetyltransferase
VIDPTVRPAAPHDAAELRWVEHGARTALEGQRGAERWLDTSPAVDLAWDEHISAGEVFVAHIDDVVVGYLRVGLDGEVATIHDVFVVEAARELGFGDELLAAAVADVRRRGARFLEGHALPGDRNTKNLFERAGIKARLIIVSVPLAD